MGTDWFACPEDIATRAVALGHVIAFAKGETRTCNIGLRLKVNNVRGRAGMTSSETGIC